MDRRCDSVNLNICSPNEHVRDIERSNYTVKERTRSTLTVLPFRRITIIMVIQAVMLTILWLNSLPPMNGVSARLSPATIVTSKSTDARIH